MKTVEGVELKLGKCKLMPVKKLNGNKDELNKRVENYYTVGKMERSRIENMTPLKDDGISICKNARMVKNPYLVRMEAKYYDRILSKVKPANYKD